MTAGCNQFMKIIYQKTARMQLYPMLTRGCRINDLINHICGSIFFVFLNEIQEYIQNQLQNDLEYDQMTLKEYIDPFTGETVNQNK